MRYCFNTESQIMTAIKKKEEEKDKKNEVREKEWNLKIVTFKEN